MQTDVISMIKKKYFPERKIVVVSVKLEGVADYALEPTKFFSKHGIRMLSCIVQSHPDRRLIHSTIFLDLTESDLTPEEMLSRLRLIPHVKQLEVLDLPLTHGEARLAVFTLEDIHYLFGMLRELGDGGLAIMYHMGFRAGEALAEKIFSYFNDNRRSLEYMLLYNESLGRGIFKLEEFIDKKYCRIRVRELLECLSVKSSNPNSHIFRGMLAGFLAKLWGREVEVKETKCIAIGDPHCEFEVRAEK